MVFYSRAFPFLPRLNKTVSMLVQNEVRPLSQ